MSFGKETMAEVPESIQRARETAREIMFASHEDVDVYVRTRRRLELALINVRGARLRGYLGLSGNPSWIADSLDCSHPAVRAAFLTSAVAYKAWVYTHAHKKVPLFTKVWNHWNTARVAGETNELVGQLTPVVTGLFTGVDLERIRHSFWEAIKGGAQEGIIITGLDGSGKSTLTGALVRFLEQLGLRVSRENFPRRDSTIGALARSVLTGGERVDPRALQFLMIADALDYLWTDSSLPVYDRHPIADALVYSPPGVMEVALLAARELFASSPTWLIIVDRHPVNCGERIHARTDPPELFEQGVQDMVAQMVRFMGLVHLPGVVWVNNDLQVRSTDGLHRVLTLSAQRVIGALVSRDVIQRALLRQGICSTLEQAWRIVESAFAATRYENLFPSDI